MLTLPGEGFRCDFELWHEFKDILETGHMEAGHMGSGLGLRASWD